MTGIRLSLGLVVSTTFLGLSWLTLAPGSPGGQPPGRDAAAASDTDAEQPSGSNITLTINVDKTSVNLGELLPVRIQLSNTTLLSRFWEGEDICVEPVSISTGRIRSGVNIIWANWQRHGFSEDALDLGVTESRSFGTYFSPDRPVQDVRLSPGDYFGITEWFTCGLIGEYVLTCSYATLAQDAGSPVPTRTLECRSATLSVRIDKGVFDGLITRLKNPDEKDVARGQIMNRLSANSITPAIPFLLTLMKEDNSTFIRRAAVYSLSNLAKEDLGLPGDWEEYDEAVHPIRVEEWARKYIESHPEILEPTEQFFETFMAQVRAKHDKRILAPSKGETPDSKAYLGTDR